MKCIILGAGYATRLYPLTENFPKPLLEINEGKAIIDYIVDSVNKIDEIDQIYVITNNRYYEHFVEWSNNKNNVKPITVFNDNTNSNDDRLGAIGDINFTIKKANIDDDLICIAGDNLFDYSLVEYVDYFKEKKSPVVLVEEMSDINQLRAFAVAKIDDNNKVIFLEEKPEEPKSNLGVWATLIYPRNVLKHFDLYLDAGNKPDAPNYFTEYLYKVEDVYAFRLVGNCFDVGTIESLEKVRELYKNKDN